MKLREFSPQNCLGRTTRITKPSIGLNKKSGLFRINKASCELIGLQEGDNVLFHQEEEDAENWYIEKTSNGGFSLRKKSAVGGGLFFNNTPLVKAIMQSHGKEEELSFNLTLAGQPTKMEKRKLFGLLAISKG